MPGTRTEFHLAPYNAGWQIKRDGTAVFELPTKAETVDKAAAEGRLAHPAQVVIHRKDGTIDDERTYDDDPFRPRG